MFFLTIFAVAVLTPPVFAQDIRDVKPPAAYPSGPWLWLAGFVLAVAAVAAAVWTLVKYLRNRPTPAVLPTPSWVIARRRLSRLKDRNLPAQGRLKEYFSELSDIVRRYVEDRFAINAPEMTTEEFLVSLGFSDTLNAAQKQSLKNFMICCDMVKFAKYSANPNEVEQSLEAAQRLVEETQGPED